jgi:nucleoid-associated protein YgaU
MNHAKIAAALHALADAFLEGAEEQPAKATKSKAKATAVAEPAAPVAVEAPAAAVAPTITKDQLNKLVLKVAAKSRDTAMAILGKFGQQNTVTLPPEQWQAVYDAFEEEVAKQDAAAVQVAQASLV